MRSQRSKLRLSPRFRPRETSLLWSGGSPCGRSSEDHLQEGEERHVKALPMMARQCVGSCDWKGNVGALTIRTGFCGILYYNYNKEPPKMVLVRSRNGVQEALKPRSCAGEGCRWSGSRPSKRSRIISSPQKCAVGSCLFRWSPFRSSPKRTCTWPEPLRQVCSTGAWCFLLF